MNISHMQKRDSGVTSCGYADYTLTRTQKKKTMSRASQFIDFINTRNLSDKGEINAYYKTRLTGLNMNPDIKAARKEYLKAIGTGYAPISEYRKKPTAKD